VSGRDISVAERHSFAGGYALAQGALLGLCAATGVAAGVKPVLGIGLALGVVFVVLVMRSAFTGVVLFTLMSFLEVASLQSSALSLMKVVGALLFVSWLVIEIREQHREGRSTLRGEGRILVLAFGFLAWSAVSFAWSHSPSASAATTWRYLQDVLVLPIVIGALRRRDQVPWIMAAFVVGGMVAAAYGFLAPQATAVGGLAAAHAGRLAATNLDPNGIAVCLVVGISFAPALIRALRGHGLLQRCVAAAIPFEFVALFDTQSRSGIVALVSMLAAGVLFGGRWRRRAGWALVLVVTAALAYVAATPAHSDQHLASTGTSGRTDLWVVGWRIFETHPFIGVGSGNYEVTSVDYLNEPGLITRADLIVDTPFPTHNVYLQLLAELGIPGLMLFLAVAFVAASSGLRAAARFRDSGRADLELAARGYVGALAAWMASNFFEPNQFAKQLWLLIALGPALLALAVRGSARPRPAPSRPDAPARTPAFAVGQRSPG
jgi:putative inorganic carbon (HCO3(-)) transporter